MFKRKRGSQKYGSSKRFKGGQSAFSRPRAFGYPRPGFRPSQFPGSGTLIGGVATNSQGANQPDRLRLKVKTYINLTLNSAAGAFGANAIKLNSLHAPFTSFSSSHQNPTISNLSTIYERYRVQKARLTLSLAPITSAATPVPVFVAITALDNQVNSVSLTGFQQVLESRLGRFKICPTIAGYTGQPVVVKLTTTPEAVAGLTQLQQSASEQFSGSMNTSATISDPPQQQSFYVAFQSQDGSTGSEISVEAFLIQWVELYGRAQYA